MSTEDYSVRLLDGIALTSADVYGFICRTMPGKEVSVHVRNVGTGTPVGVWKFQISNDPAAESEFWTEQKSGTRIGSSSTAKWVALDDPTTVHGDSLTLGGGGAQGSVVSFVDGLGRYFRVWYDYTSGGSAASLGTVDVTVKA